MKSTLREVLHTARALSCSGCTEVTHELVATLDATGKSDRARYVKFKVAVDVGVEQFVRGEGIEISFSEHRRRAGCICQ